MRSLNFNSIKKQYLPVTFSDDKTILVGTPTLSLLNAITDLQERASNLDADSTTDATREIYNICARVMSHNKTGYKVTVDYLEEVLDIEDIMIFFNAYMDFVTEVSNAKN